MDYLFYGNVAATEKVDTITILLNIHCEPDETINLYELSSDASHRLVYKQVPVEHHADSLVATFDVPNSGLSLFIISGQSNESDIPFEVTYAVSGGEIVALPENSIVQLEGSTYIFPDGQRKICP